MSTLNDENVKEESICVVPINIAVIQQINISNKKNCPKSYGFLVNKKNRK